MLGCGRLTNITFVVDKRQDSNFRFAQTGIFTQPWTMNASPTIVTRAAGTWANAKQRLKQDERYG